jgi:hypothetical protein
MAGLDPAISTRAELVKDAIPISGNPRRLILRRRL